MRPELWSSDSGDEIARTERGIRSLVSASLDPENGEVVVKIGDSGSRPEGSTGRHKVPFSVLLEVIAAASDSEKIEDITDLIARAIAVFIPGEVMQAQFDQEVQKCKGHIANLARREERKDLTASLKTLGDLQGEQFERAFAHLKTDEFPGLYSALGILRDAGVEARRQKLKASMKAGRKTILLHVIEHLGNKFLELTDQDDITFDSDPAQLFCIHASSDVVESERVKAAKNTLMSINMITSLVDDPLGKKVARFNADYDELLPGNQPSSLKLGVFRAAGAQLSRMPQVERDRIKAELIKQVQSWHTTALPNEELERKVATCFFELLDLPLESFANPARLKVDLIRYEAALLLAFRHITTGDGSEGKITRIRTYFREQITTALKAEIGLDKDKSPSPLSQRLEKMIERLTELKTKDKDAKKDKKKELTRVEKKELAELDDSEPQIRHFLQESKKIKFTPAHRDALKTLPPLPLPKEIVKVEADPRAAFASGAPSPQPKPTSGGTRRASDPDKVAAGKRPQ